ncbi:MAG: hypothetical protein QE495_19885 [Acidovorax sp.]|uniref:hypothetical protein n=1 Tax=Acidovorax sp. TaxID=1872122 RepID=UPI0026323A1B|nr:hypothetical protein [Acidovorax sp.]MDH4428713.1 hypothetical protein [Acidovorax sp.]
MPFNTPYTTTNPLRRLITLATLSTAALLATTLPVHAHGEAHSHAPQHGGVVVEVKDIDLELVAKPGVLQLYLRDHGKPADVSKASAKVTLLSGTEKQEAALTPAGDRLEAKGSFRVAAGTKALAQVTVGGKVLSARFEMK